MLSDLSSKALNFALSGHSLGGALASLALIKNVSGKAGICHPAACQLVTFGQPKVGGVNVAKQLTDLGAVRYVNQGDLITKVPTIGYEHGGSEFFLPGWLEDDYSMWSVIKNHSIDSYVKRLETIKAS
jgi:predicted lipase